MLPTIPARPAWAGPRDDADLADAARVVADPLTGQIPTWAPEPGRLVYDAVVAELGDPFTLDTRITAALEQTAIACGCEDIGREIEKSTSGRRWTCETCGRTWVADAPETTALALAGRAA